MNELIFLTVHQLVKAIRQREASAVEVLEAHLEHIALQTESIEADVGYLRGIGVPVYQDKVFDAPDGYEAFVYPDQTPGMTVELIQPHATSWDYPE